MTSRTHTTARDHSRMIIGISAGRALYAGSSSIGIVVNQPGSATLARGRTSSRCGHRREVLGYRVRGLTWWVYRDDQPSPPFLTPCIRITLAVDDAPTHKARVVLARIAPLHIVARDVTFRVVPVVGNVKT